MAANISFDDFLCSHNLHFCLSNQIFSFFSYYAEVRNEFSESHFPCFALVTIQFLSKKCRSGGHPVAKRFQDLNLGLPLFWDESITARLTKGRILFMFLNDIDNNYVLFLLGKKYKKAFCTHFRTFETCDVLHSL